MGELTKKEVLVEALYTVKQIDEEVSSLLLFIEEELEEKNDYGLNTLQTSVGIVHRELKEELEKESGD